MAGIEKLEELRKRVNRIRILTLRKPFRTVLCGIKHCGKSFLGRALADALGVPFYDADDLLKADAGKPVRQLYREVGEQRFRELEAASIRKFTASAPERAVVALGGGAASNPVLTPDDLHALGVVVWLDVPVCTAFERMQREGLPPFLADAADPVAEFDRICDERRPKYQAIADAVLPIPEVRPVEEVVDALLELLESKGSPK